MRGLAARLRRLHPLSWVAIALLAAAIVAIPLGGWDTVRLVSADPPDLAVGEQLDGRRFAVTVQGAEILAAHPDGYTEPEPGGAFVALRVRVENRWVDPEYSWALPREMLVADLDGVVLEEGIVLLAVDLHRAPVLGPNVPTDVLIVWEMPAATVDASELHIEFLDGVPRQDSEIIAGTVWRDLRVVAESWIPLAPGAA